MSQRTGINVSAHDGSSGSNHQLIQDKKVFESCGVDSGFMSGEVYSSQSIDSHSDFIEVDAPPPPTDTSVEFESGIIRDFKDEDEQQENNTKDIKNQAPMIIQTAVDGNLTEWFCGLNLKNPSVPLNNLNKEPLIEAEKPVHRPAWRKQLETRPLWEVCYIQDEDGDTQLHLAILGKHVKAIWPIIRLAPVPAFLDIRNDDAHSPLHLAVLTRQPEIVRRLVTAGAKVTTPDREGNTPLHLACMNSDRACVDALTRPMSHEEVQEYYNYSNRLPQVHPLDLEYRNYHGIRCVHIAAQRNDIEILRYLVWLGADINAREGRSGYTVLHMACENGNEQLANFLLQECAKLNVETCTFGLLTAYQMAAENNNRNLMSNLELRGAEVLAPPESDDDSYFDSSEEDRLNYDSDDCELN